MKLGAYREHKPRRCLRILWFLLNGTIFNLLTRKQKVALLKLFGAKVKNWSMFKRGVRIYSPWNLTIGNALVGPHVEIYDKGEVKIGDDVIISQDAYLCTASHDTTSPTMDLITKPIVIEDNVWIAAKATILPGVTIGEGAVVGACAVVSKDVPPWSVVVGNPARVVGRRNLMTNVSTEALANADEDGK